MGILGIYVILCLRNVRRTVSLFSHVYFNRDMNRKRTLISDTFKVKKRRIGTERFGAVDNGEGTRMSWEARRQII